MSTFEVLRVGHLNHVAADYDETKAAYERVLGAVFWQEWATAAEGTRNALVAVSDMCVEVFAVDGPGAMASSLDRRGPGWHSIEWTLPSLDEAVAVCAEHDVRIAQLAPLFAFTHPRDCHGLCIELTAARFPRDPRDHPELAPQPSFWRDEHALGLTGFGAVRVSSPDPEASAAWLAKVTGIGASRESAMPGLSARAVAVDLPGHTIEFVSPDGTGPMRSFLDERGACIHSVSFVVADLDAARAHLGSLGVAVTPGTTDAGVFIAPAALAGALVELTQAP